MQRKKIQESLDFKNEEKIKILQAVGVRHECIHFLCLS